MALTKNHSVALGYIKGDGPRDINRIDLHIHDELRKVESSIRRLNQLAPQAADAEPDEKLIGMIRFAIASTWDPLTTGVDTWVYWNGSNWVAL